MPIGTPPRLDSRPMPPEAGYAVVPIHITKPQQEPALVENIDLLKRLCETPGVPGREDRVRALIEKEVKGLFDSVVTDPMGNLICRRGPRSGKKGKNGGKASGKGEDRPTRVMLLSHM